MKMRIFLMSFFAVSASLFAETNTDAEKVKWLHNYDQAIQQAKETAKPILLEFRCAP